jgi:hypothetical protein
MEDRTTMMMNLHGILGLFLMLRSKLGLRTIVAEMRSEALYYSSINSRHYYGTPTLLEWRFSMKVTI